MKSTTTVEVVFSAAHRDPVSGVLHGHDYQVRVTFPRGERFEALKIRVASKTAKLDHTQTPPALWAAEDIAEWLLAEIPDALKVAVNRPWLGHFAEVER